MRDTAPISQGILAVAVVFGLIGGGVAYVVYGFGVPSAGLIGGFVALLVAVVLALGWRDPAPRRAVAAAVAAAPVRAMATPAAHAAPVVATADLPPVSADGKPEGMAAPRNGQADDLKQIKGVGPKLEAMLNEMGYWHFDQIAAWRAAEVAWVDENLEGFKGRVSRDDWVSQAKILAAGGSTAFSDKVEKGGVY